MNKVIIQCVNEECAYHQEGFSYEPRGGKLTNDKDNPKAYNLLIDCPNGHKNKIWMIPDDRFLDDLVGAVVRF